MGRHLPLVHDSDQYFLGYVIDDVAAHVGLPRDAIVNYIGCPPAMLPRLALQAVPDPSAPDFDAAVARVAGQTGANVGRLAILLRCAGALHASPPIPQVLPGATGGVPHAAAVRLEMSDNVVAPPTI